MGGDKILEGSKLAETDRMFRAVFTDALGTATRWSTQVTQRVPVTGSELKPKWLARTSGVNEWLDNRQVDKLRAYDLSVLVKKWSNGIEIDADDLEDDDSNLGLYRPAIASMADDFVEQKHQLIIDLLANGFTAAIGTAYDGQFFFDTDHVDNPENGTQSNLTTAALDTAGVAFRAGRTAMVNIKKPNGQFANLRPTHIIVPQALEGVIEQLFAANILGSGATNTLFNAVTPIIDPRLDVVSTTAWFLWDSSKSLLPFIMADRRSVRMRAKVNPNEGQAYDRDVFEWGGDGRYNSGYYFWQTMHGSTGLS